MRQAVTPASAATFAATLLVLGIVGWSAGWLAAGAQRTGQGQGVLSATATPPPATTAPPPPTSPSPEATATATIRADAFPMPDLVGMKFREARQAAIDKRLSVEVRFGESGRAGTVVKTDPVADLYVWPGLAIFLFVAGDAPAFLLPDVEGKSCAQAKAQLLDAGVKIKGYPSGQKGTVAKTAPSKGTLVSWNAQVEVYCRELSASPADASG